MDPREPFCAAIRSYHHHRDWRPAMPDHPRLPVDDRALSYREICNLVSELNDELPDRIVGNLLAALGRYPDLVEAFARTRSYAIGAHCFRTLLDRRIENYKQTNPWLNNV
jgi:hypothetical protein